VDTPQASIHLSSLINGGYVKEILPEMRGVDRAAPGKFWTGSLLPEPTLIVSMISIKSRLPTLSLVISSILKQSRQPDRFILNISADAYLKDDGIPETALPSQIMSYREAGLLEINYVENTGPYRKLLPTLRKEWDSNCVIVTADDDTLYPAHWLDELYQTFLARRTIVAYRCTQIAMENGAPRPYLDWVKPYANDEVKDEYKDVFRFPTGKDGVLYSPAFFTEHVFDLELIRLAPTADDLMFKLASMVTTTPVIAAPRSLSGSGRYAEFPVVLDRPDGLWDINTDGKNDQSLARLLEYLEKMGILDLRAFFE